MSKKHLFVLALVLFFVLASRAWPLIKHGQAGLGYDTGFYLKYIKTPFNDFPRAPIYTVNQEALGTRVFLDILTKTTAPPEYILFGSYLLMQLIMAFLFFLLVRTIFKDEKVALLALLIYACSPTQYLAYWFMLYKQTFALIFLFLSFYLIEKRSLWFAVTLLITAISHRSTSFMALISLIPQAVYLLKNKRKVIFIALSAIAFFSFMLWFNRWGFEQIVNSLKGRLPKEDIFSIKTGQFITTKDYLMLSILYLPFAFFGFYLSARKKIINPIFFLTLAALFIVIFKLIFYRRIIPFLDIGVIIYSAYGAFFAKNWARKKLPKQLITALIAIWFAFLPLSAAKFIKNLNPIISPRELDEIKKFNPPEKDAFLMSADMKYAPWLYGWTEADQRVITPGLFWDIWTYEQWVQFWTGGIETQKKMLEQYQAPIYIFDPTKNYNFMADSCFKPISNFIVKFSCEN